MELWYKWRRDRMAAGWCITLHEIRNRPRSLGIKQTWYLRDPCHRLAVPRGLIRTFGTWILVRPVDGVSPPSFLPPTSACRELRGLYFWCPMPIAIARPEIQAFYMLSNWCSSFPCMFTGLPSYFNFWQINDADRVKIRIFPHVSCGQQPHWKSRGQKCGSL